MSNALTRGIRVTVKAQYLPERSAPHARQYVFAYTVRISNEGTENAQLRSRHWIITANSGHEHEVVGDGVVGAQPVLRPGQHFEYTSGCALPTARGFMRGSFHMVTDKGEEFDAEVARFDLAMPHSLN